MPRSVTKTPLYQQLYAELRSRIQSGAWQAGDLIPSESELTKAHGLSRITVRAALDQLVQDGLIDRFAGRGSFVKQLEPETTLCLTSFTEQVLILGKTPRTTLLRLDPLTAGTAPSFFGQQQAVMIERLRYVDGQTAALVRSYLPATRVRGINKTHFEETGRAQSLLFILEHYFGIVLDAGEETIAATRIDEPEASLLGLSTGAAVVERKCLVKNVQGDTVLYEIALWSMPQTQLLQRRVTARRA